MPPYRSSLCRSETEYNGLFLAGFLAFQCFINRYANGVKLSGAGRMPSILANCSAASNTEVCSGARLHQPIVIQLRDNGAHAMIPQTACVVRGGIKPLPSVTSLPEGLPCLYRRSHTQISLLSGRTGCRFNCDNLIILFAAQLFRP